MPLYSLGRIAKIRAKAQTTASLETKEAVVTRTYANTIRVTNCDVLVKGQQKTLFNIPNSSISNWSVGDTVLVNLVRGNSNRPQIIGAAGATTSNSVAGNLNALATGSGTTGASQQLAGIPFLIEEQSSLVSGAFVVSPGVNVYFDKTTPELASGGYNNGGLIMFMKRLVLFSLPNAATTQLLDGLLVDLIDSYRNQLGMYRLDKSIPAWVREDVGTGGSGLLGSLPTDYISGCYLSYDNNTSFFVNTGTFYYPGGSTSVTITAQQTITPTLAASTLYYVYGSGPTSFVVSSTAPTSKYQGYAWQDSNGRRYLGSFLTDGSAHIVPFYRQSGSVYYVSNVSVSPLLILSAGTSTVVVSVSAAGIVPSTSQVLLSQITFTFGSTPTGAIGTSNNVPTTTSGNILLGPVTGGSLSWKGPVPIPLNTSQAFQYILGNGGILNVFGCGYQEDR